MRVLFVNSLLRDSWAAVRCDCGVTGFISKDEYEGKVEVCCTFCGFHTKIIPSLPIPNSEKSQH